MTKQGLGSSGPIRRRATIQKQATFHYSVDSPRSKDIENFRLRESRGTRSFSPNGSREAPRRVGARSPQVSTQAPRAKQLSRARTPLLATLACMAAWRAIVRATQVSVVTLEALRSVAEARLTATRAWLTATDA